MSTIVAAPDGTLFAATDSALLRSHLRAPERWEQIARTDDMVTLLFAPVGDAVYAITRRCGALYRWSTTTGWQALQLPPIVQSTPEGEDRCVFFTDLWGSGPADIYAAGYYGTILHYDGQRWQEEPNPIQAAFASGALPSEAAGLWSIAGAGGAVYATSGVAVLSRDASGWVMLPLAQPGLPSRCAPARAAASDNGVLFGDNQCLTAFESGRWRLLAEWLPGFRGSIYRALTQRDGAQLFWSYVGSVAVVRDGQPSVYVLDGLAPMGGAITIGPYLYAAGRLGTDGVVLRARRF
ncbi:MAG TPA: hypothetical protein VFS05_00365 [Gemmatimonadaceae bacterium]|nr:hypothetical protein [Gemmatimonadaceae bacterium]